ETDPLYGEAVGRNSYITQVGSSSMTASAAIKPKPEILSRFGMQGPVDVLLFIPRGYITDFEEREGFTFEPALDWYFDLLGIKYNIASEPRRDPLPVADGTTWDYIGMVITGSIK